MGRFTVAALLVVLAACEKEAAPRLFTDADIAGLEARLMAHIAESRADCVSPQQLALFQSIAKCEGEWLRSATPTKQHELDARDAEIDMSCGTAWGLAAIRRARAFSPALIC